jgi:translin
MRQGKLDGCEDILRDMDEIYGLLISLDFPDAITGNLRRTTDATRGILEKTRGDFTLGVTQARFTEALAQVEDDLRRLYRLTER